MTTRSASSSRSTRSCAARSRGWPGGSAGRRRGGRGSDRSLDLLRALAAAEPGVSRWRSRSRCGQQAALLAGLDHSDADAVVMLDSDLQHPPSVDPQPVARHEQGFDVVYTVREERRLAPARETVERARLYGW